MTGQNPERTRYQLIHLHRAGQGQHVAAFPVGNADLVLCERADDVFQRQALTPTSTEVVQQQLRLLRPRRPRSTAVVPETRDYGTRRVQAFL
jgi:hypothetical protein